MTGRRARDWGIPFAGVPGPLDAITDVAGVRVGHCTVVSGTRPDGSDAARTGVTAILPTPTTETEAVFAGWHNQNGNGELTGTPWIDETGLLDGPILTTNTLSVGVVRDAVVAWAARRGLLPQRWAMPVVGETWDGHLNDIRGFHVRPEHAHEAIERATGGAVPEGNVGGGTGMVCYEAKGGIGSASRVARGPSRWTVGVLVQANHGLRRQLTIAGLPVGAELPVPAAEPEEHGSILVFVATDAPLLPHQLRRLARRATMGLARSGSVSGNSSGDLFLAFSTANRGAVEGPGPRSLSALAEPEMNPLFESAVEATDEAIVNALAAAETMEGYRHHRVEALPMPRVVEILQRHGRLASPA